MAAHKSPVMSPTSPPSPPKILMLAIVLFSCSHPCARRAVCGRRRAALLARRRLVEHRHCCRPPPISSRRAWSCSPAPPAPGKACSRCTAGSCSSAQTRRMDPLRRGRLGRAGAHQWLAGGRPLVRQRAGRDRRCSGAAGRAADPQDRSGDRAIIATGRPAITAIWPGPNSNSFVAAVLRAVPELGVALPPNAVGRDFRDGFYAGLTDSRTGIELNLYGLAGMKLGWVEGIEVESARPGRRARLAPSRR